MKQFLIFSILIILTATVGFAETPDPARDIMVRVDNRNDGETLIARVRLTSYRFARKGGKNIPAEKPRIKEMDFVKKDYGPNGKDHRSISIVLQPESEKGIGFLQYDYQEPGKDTDQWMYLSSFGKVKRIVSGNENEPKTGSFFGSEFNYEDMEELYIDDYTYRLLGNETYRGKSCAVIETFPVPEKALKSNYSRGIMWVDTDRHLVLKTLLFNRNGKKTKKIVNGKIKEINGVLIATAVSVVNLEANRRTLMTYENIRIDNPVEDSFLTRRTLTDKVFREKTLRQQGI